MKQRLKQVGKRCPKLSFQSFGPFPISKVINEVSPQLGLPPSWTMHNVFHVSWLKPYTRPQITNIPDTQPHEILDEAKVIEPSRFFYTDASMVLENGRGSSSPSSKTVAHMRQFGLEFPQLLADYFDAMHVKFASAEARHAHKRKRR